MYIYIRYTSENTMYCFNMLYTKCSTTNCAENDVNNKWSSKYQNTDTGRECVIT